MNTTINAPGSSLIIVVNDDVAQLRIMSTLLRQEGWQVLTFCSAEEALQGMVNALSPALIITDLYMPLIDGWRFCRLLRSPEYREFNATPLLVVSATFSGEEAARVTIETGADGFEPIPLNIPRFLQTTRNLLRGKKQPTNRLVLIIEDSRSMALLLQREFAAQGYQAHVAGNAFQGMELFQRLPFELVVLDYHLPDSTGDELLDMLVAFRPGTVCVVITSDTRPEIALECTRKGAAAYVRKPFSPDYLIELCAKARRERTLLRVEDRLEERTRELRASEARYRSVLENILDVYYRTDAVGIITLASPSAVALLGCSGLEEIVGRPATKFYYSPKERRRLLLDLQRHGSVLDYELTLKRKNGTPVAVSANSRLRRDEHGTILGVEGTLRDITKRKQAEAARIKAESRYKELFDNAPVAIFQATPTGRFLRVNPMYAEMAGYGSPEEMMNTVTDIASHLYLTPTDRETYKRVLERSGMVRNYQVRLKRRDGTPFWVSINAKAVRDQDGAVISYDGFLSDITQEKELESQLRQAQKVEALGTLAGGMAHDFNNILQAVGGMAQLMLERKTKDDEDYQGLQSIRKACGRGAQLIRQLLAYSRKTPGDRQPVDLNREISEAVAILKRTIPKMVDIHVHLDPGLRPIMADPLQIEQIILNLGTNAADAMDGNGVLTLSTQNVTVKDVIEGSPTGLVRLLVTDTGHGMDPATTEKVFDPFFTTKEVDKGTGLGLASVYGTVQSHGGRIDCFSTPGSGTTFLIDFPASNEPLAPSIEPPSSLPEAAIADNADKQNQLPPIRILVVDDDDLVRETTVEGLRLQGYTVEEVSRGEHALERIQNDPEAFHLVILDLNMPGMGGLKTLSALLRVNPKLRILIVSGYIADGYGSSALTTGAVGFLSKPFQLQELEGEVRKALEPD
ncbi:response regulator [Desulfonatronum thioautotrophicum]|uniref:response regulator n=1 Tax=Desulfonatronum thioautotrophicum TaxID=617001 RepID=UPI0005EBEDF2|nr:response regulator [Desulfonatronum thioautotrophicum]